MTNWSNLSSQLQTVSSGQNSAKSNFNGLRSQLSTLASQKPTQDQKAAAKQQELAVLETSLNQKQLKLAELVAIQQARVSAEESFDATYVPPKASTNFTPTFSPRNASTSFSGVVSNGNSYVSGLGNLSQAQKEVQAAMQSLPASRDPFKFLEKILQNDKVIFTFEHTNYVGNNATFSLPFTVPSGGGQSEIYNNKYAFVFKLNSSLVQSVISAYNNLLSTNTSLQGYVTPLQQAVNHANSKIAEYDAAIEATKTQISAIDSAMASTDLETIILSDLDLQDPDGETALIKACKQGGENEINIQAFVYLTDHNPDLNKADKDGNTALHILVQKGIITQAKLLISRSQDPANPYLPNLEGKTAFMLAEELELVELRDEIIAQFGEPRIDQVTTEPGDIVDELTALDITSGHDNESKEATVIIGQTDIEGGLS